MGHLALGDAFVVTADSVSMLSEACSTGYVAVFKSTLSVFPFHVDGSGCLYPGFLYCRKPVYVIGAERCKWKFSHFIKTLQSRGAIRLFTGAENVSNLYPSVL